MARTTLGKRTISDGFRANLAAWFRSGAVIAERNPDGQTLRPHVAALRDTADYIERCDLYDQNLRTLEAVSSSAGWGGSTTPWEPGNNSALTLRSNLGRPERVGPDGAPTPSETLAELASLAVEDAWGQQQEASAEAQAETKRLRNQLKELGDVEERKRKLAEQLDAAKAELAQERTTSKQLREDLTYERGVNAAKPKKKPTSKKTAAAAA